MLGRSAQKRAKRIRVKTAGALSARAVTDADRLRRSEEAVVDLPDPKPRKLRQEDVEALRKAGLTEFAELAERYVGA